MLTVVSSPREKSKISSLSSFRMTMLFSHSSSLVFEALTMSVMKDGHLLGQSCFRICTAWELSAAPISLGNRSGVHAHVLRCPSMPCPAQSAPCMQHASPGLHAACAIILAACNVQ